jgi:hypothetical protein
MKNILSSLTLCSMLILGMQPVLSQVEVVSALNMNVIDNTNRLNQRTPEAGDYDVVVNSTIQPDLFFNEIGNEILDQDDLGINRLIEQFAPSYRYYLTSKSSVSAGILISRKTQSVIGENLADTTIISDFSSLDMGMKSRSVSLRLAYNKHNSPVYFRYFNLDTYFGAALSLGRTKSVEETNIDYIGGDDYNYLKTTTPSTAIGAELYTGLALRFDIVSIGAELLLLGFDRQAGFGVSEVEYDYSEGNSIGNGSYFVSSDELPNQFAGQYSSLNARSTSTSMYRGIRFNVVLHLNN